MNSLKGDISIYLKVRHLLVKNAKHEKVAPGIFLHFSNESDNFYEYFESTYLIGTE